jgi:electron transport complex protein RnfC
MTREIWTIPGGIHPPENKAQSLHEPIAPAGLPDRLVLPLSQHLGAPAEPVVEVGDVVLKGQIVAKASGPVSVPVHAPTSGIVKSIESHPIPHMSGLSGQCIILTPDGKDEWCEHCGVSDYKVMERSEVLELIRQAGICGMGGAGFPTAVKLDPGPKRFISKLIINGTECEPYITADDILMRERAEEIVAGIKILAWLLEPQEILVGIEDNKPEAIAAMEAAIADSGIEVVSFHTKYPSGGEKQLIQILTGKEVPSGGLPADIGVICQNIGTTYAVHHAIAHGEPLISRITTMTGDAIGKPGNYEVLLGTPIRHLLALTNYCEEKANRLIMGGPMMGFALSSADVPVVKTTNCILAPTTEELPPPPPAQSCIRCGMCSEACPANLLPQQLYWYSRSREYEKLKEYNLADCIECGACSYVCPSSIPLVQYYRHSKAEIKALELERANAERARNRFESREARLKKVEDEKAAKRAARQAAAKKKKQAVAPGKKADKDDKADLIKAAVERAKAKKAATNTEQPAAKEANKGSDDPAQAAIEKALAARNSTATLTPREKLEKSIASIEKRLDNTRKKLDEARQQESDVAEMLQEALGKLENKLEQSQKELAELDRQEA